MQNSNLAALKGHPQECRHNHLWIFLFSNQWVAQSWHVRGAIDLFEFEYSLSIMCWWSRKLSKRALVCNWHARMDSTPLYAQCSPCAFFRRSKVAISFALYWRQATQIWSKGLFSTPYCMSKQWLLLTGFALKSESHELYVTVVQGHARCLSNDLLNFLWVWYFDRILEYFTWNSALGRVYSTNSSSWNLWPWIFPAESSSNFSRKNLSCFRKHTFIQMYNCTSFPEYSWQTTPHVAQTFVFSNSFLSTSLAPKIPWVTAMFWWPGRGPRPLFDGHPWRRTTAAAAGHLWFGGVTTIFLSPGACSAGIP